METNNNSAITTVTTEIALAAQVEAQTPTVSPELPVELLPAQQEPVVVATEEPEAPKYRHVLPAEVPGLIAAGENPILLRSYEAPHGYKLDGTPAAQRGRKTGSGQGPTKKVLANPKHGNVGKLFRAQEGAPYGVKSDGSPAKKRGRPSKNTVVVTKSSIAEAQAIVAEAQAVVTEAQKTLSEAQASVTEAQATVTEAQAIVEAANSALVAEEIAAAAVVEKVVITKGSKVQMVAAACKTEKQAKLTGQVKQLSSLFAFVHWNNGQQQWRALETLQVVA